MTPHPTVGTVAHMEAGWYPDPLGRFQERYHDGKTWTFRVSDGHGELVDETDKERLTNTTFYVAPRKKVDHDFGSMFVGLLVLVGVIVLLVVTLSGGGDSPKFERSMVVSSKVIGSKSFEQVRVVALAPGLKADDSSRVASQCAKELGEGHLNGATCWVYPSQAALDSAELNRVEATVKYPCWVAMSVYRPGHPSEDMSLTPESLVGTGCTL